MLVLTPALMIACTDAEPPAVEFMPALGGTTFDLPVDVGDYGDGRTFVAERGGRIWLVDDGGDRDLLVDVSGMVDAVRGEGLLSVALDPSFAATGHLWIYYFASDDPPRTVLARITVSNDVADLATQVIAIEMEQPGFNQNGGAVRFGGDGYLYLSVGDGSASEDPFDQGQDTSTLLATVLRLDVSHTSLEEPYRVPGDNPFLDQSDVRPEIFAYGLRNPWRMAIDVPSGEIWLGDVGVSVAEEVNHVTAGGNYGWSILEGDRCVRPRDCPAEGLLPPISAYDHSEGRCAVIGGVVYRGASIPHLDGYYLFGDLCSGEVWRLDRASGEATLLTRFPGSPVTFGVDASGEVLVADYAGGGVYWLTRSP